MNWEEDNIKNKIIMINKLNIKDGANFLSAYSHYCELVSYFAQLDPKNDKIKELVTDPYYKCPLVTHWDEIEIHITNQMWGSTSCGWGGMGGSAMTSDYNFIIKQKYSNLLFVYWGGQLAYIINADEIKDYKHMPSRADAKAIYKK